MIRERPNIVLLCLDSARSDRFSCYGYARKTSPNLDSLARESVLYRNAIATAPWTVPSHASLFTGLYTKDHRTIVSSMPKDVGPTMAEMLQDTGYNTAAVTANPWLTSRSGILRGFDTTVELPPLGRKHDAGWKRSLSQRIAKAQVLLGMRGTWLYPEARTVSEHAMSAMCGMREPFLLFVNYMDTHAPYLPSWPRAAGWSPSLAGLKARRDWWVVCRKQTGWDVLVDDREDLLEALSDFYDGDLASTDRRLGELIDWVDSRRWQRPVLLMVFSDHGENLGDHGLMYHFGCLYDTLLRVPLMVRAPSILPQGAEIQAQVQLSDVMPSLLAVTGAAGERQGVLYRDRPNLLDMEAMADRDWPAYAEYYPGQKIKQWQKKASRFNFTPLDRSMRAVRTRQHKYIAASDGSAELFDLQRDSAECEDLLASADNEAQPVAEALQRQLNRDLPEPEWGAHAEDEEYEAEAADQLRGLGYL